MTIHDLDTPTLLIDVRVLDRNLRKMAKYCDEHKLRLRPHTKTHKMPEIARLQLQHGAAGITVAKLSEAQVMADVTLAHALSEVEARLAIQAAALQNAQSSLDRLRDSIKKSADIS